MNWCKNCKNYAREICKKCVTKDSLSKPSEFNPTDRFYDSIKDFDRQIEAVKDMVNHPKHYQTESGLETIDVIKAFTENCVGIEAVCTANVIKYVTRWKKKNGLEDLKKAEWYLKYLIRHVELEESNNK